MIVDRHRDSRLHDLHQQFSMPMAAQNQMMLMADASYMDAHADEILDESRICQDRRRTDQGLERS